MKTTETTQAHEIDVEEFLPLVVLERDSRLDEARAKGELITTDDRDEAKLCILGGHSALPAGMLNGADLGGIKVFRLDDLRRAGKWEPDLIAEYRKAPPKWTIKIETAKKWVSPVEGKENKEPPTSPRDTEEESKSRGRVSIAQELVEIGRRCYLFKDEHGSAYGKVEEDGVSKVLCINGSDYRQHISGILFNETGKAANAESVRGAVNILGYFATKNPRVRLSVRFARNEEGLWLDLCDDKWRAIRITDSGWEMSEHPPILFRRFAHMLPLPVPDRNGDVHALRGFLNLANESDWILVVAWLAAALVPDIPRPLLPLHGPQGAAKTTLARFLRSVLDPSASDILHLHPDEAELAQTLDHHAVPLFDNLTKISTRQGDLLCKAVTGGGFAKRVLYSDDEDKCFSFKRPMLLTGINVPTTAPDFLDRCVLLELERIPPAHRKTEAELWREFEKAKPRILGGLLNIIPKAIQILDSIVIPQLPRMADFARFGAAVAEAMGIGAKKFLDVYDRNRDRQTEEVLENDLVARAVMEHLKSQGEWTGAPSELFKLLKERAPDPEWPKRSCDFAKRLRVLQSTLADAGIVIKFERTARERRLTIRSNILPSLPSLPSQSPPALPFLNDSTNDSKHSAVTMPSSRKASHSNGYDSNDTNDSKNSDIGEAASCTLKF